MNESLNDYGHGLVEFIYSNSVASMCFDRSDILIVQYFLND